MDAKENGEQGITGYATECGCSHGLTKREEFAKAAMAAGIADGLGRTLGPDKLGKQAVEYADGLLRALSHSAGGMT